MRGSLRGSDWVISRREATRRFGIDPRTAVMMLKFSVPPRYQRSQNTALKKPAAESQDNPCNQLLTIYSQAAGRTPSLISRVLQEPRIGTTHALLQADPRQPPHRAETVCAHQLALRPVRLGCIPNDLAAKADNPGNQ